MKSGIHPKYKICTVTCGCGTSFETTSLEETINVDVCSSCHPFFTGSERVMDTEGRIERFRKKFGNYNTADK